MGVTTSQLEQDLKAGALKGGPDDSTVVSRVLEVYLKPMQESMKEVTPVMELAGRDTRERARLLPSIMLVSYRSSATPFEGCCRVCVSRGSAGITAAVACAFAVMLNALEF